MWQDRVVWQRGSWVFLYYSRANAVAGFTNTQLSRVAKIVCQAFPDTFPAQDKVVTTGNPVRKEITEILNPSWRYQEREKAGQPLRILIVGGSLGAQALNERVPEALKQLNVPLNVYHQCGQNHAEATRARYADKPPPCRLKFSHLLKIWPKLIAMPIWSFAVPVH